MAARGSTFLDPNEQRNLFALSPMLAKMCGVSGLLVLVATFAVSLFLEGGRQRFFSAYLLNYGFFLSISLGALFFVLLQHVTRSGWSVTVRRLAEILAANLSLMAVLLIPVLLGMGKLYPGWVDGHDPVISGKQGYLNPSFFILRMAIYFAIWCWLAWRFWRSSLDQDATGDPKLSLRMGGLSGPGLVLYGFTVTFAAFDLLMSLDPHWFSTIFGVYYFSGGVVGFLAALILLATGLQGRGFLSRSVTPEHYHDLGKLLFAFVFFWGYIAFSQYMLIWYGNIPEETEWFVKRGASTDPGLVNAWSYVAILLLVGHFLIPFVGLMSRQAKRNRGALTFWAGWMLLMHWVDLYWLVLPEFHRDSLPLLIEFACLVGLGLLYLAGLAWRAGAGSLVPEKDPRLGEALAFENT